MVQPPALVFDRSASARLDRRCEIPCVSQGLTTIPAQWSSISSRYECGRGTQWFTRTVFFTTVGGFGPRGCGPTGRASAITGVRTAQSAQAQIENSCNPVSFVTDSRLHGCRQVSAWIASRTPQIREIFTWTGCFDLAKPGLIECADQRTAWPGTPRFGP